MTILPSHSSNAGAGRNRLTSSVAKRAHAKADVEGSTRTMWSLFRFIVVLAGLVLAYVASTSFLSLPTALSIQQECRMSRMWPSYQQHQPPSPSGLGSKYRLFLYRENPPSDVFLPGDPAKRKSRPALFIPGNAGSYGQVRSVASWSFTEYQAYIRAEMQDSTEEVDWWAVDFNEDFSALHSATLEGQSIYVNEALAYIMSQYPERFGRPERKASIPILAHSMGGIVARLALVQSDHPRLAATQDRVVKTIVTLSTPHSVPPAPIEADIDGIYKLVREQTPSDLLIVSLSGGILDTQLPSEYAMLDAQLPCSIVQGFTSDIAALWSSVDHLAMMWCDQLRRKVVGGFGQQGVEDADDSPVSRQTKWAKAMGLSNLVGPPFSDIASWIAEAPAVEVEDDDSVAVIPLSDAGDDDIFNLVTFAPIEPTEEGISVFLCQSGSLCKVIPPWAASEPIPPSRKAFHTDDWTRFPKADTQYETVGQSLRLLQLNAKELRAHGISSIRVMQSAEGPSKPTSTGWAPSSLAWTGDCEGNRLIFDLVGEPLLKKVKSPLRTIRLPQIDSSLFAYDFTFEPSCFAMYDRFFDFGPMFHVRYPATGDGRWYTPLTPKDIAPFTLPVTIHASSPYLPRAADGRKGLVLELYEPDNGSCRTFAKLTVKINWANSIGVWFSRYKLGLISWLCIPFGFSQAVGVLQAKDHSAARSAKVWGLSAASLLLLVLLQAYASWSSSSENLSDGTRDLLFGLVGNVSSHFGFWSSDIGFSIVLGSSLLLMTSALWTSISGSLKLLNTGLAVLFRLLRLNSFLAFDHSPDGPRVAERPRFRWSTSLAIVLMALAVKTFVPYQPIFLSAAVLQCLNAIRAAMSALRQRQTGKHSETQLSAEGRLRRRLQQNTLCYLHMVLLLPLRAPSLIIFARNVLQKTATLRRFGRQGFGFGEDHDVLRILPVLLIVQVHSTGRLLETPQGRVGVLARRAIAVLYAVLALYAMAWGIRYPYRLYDLSLLIFSGQLLSHYYARWTSPTTHDFAHKRHSLDRNRDDDDENAESIPMMSSGNGHDQSRSFWLAADDSGPIRQKREEKEVEAEILPFSIPDEFMVETGSQSMTESREGVNEPSGSDPVEALSEQTAAVALGRPITTEADPQAALDDLLSEYLSTLDTYLAKRTELQSVLSGGFFSLSAATMAAGGWGTTAGARRGLWDARLRREAEVSAEDKRKWRLRAVEPPKEAEEKEGEENAIDKQTGSSAIESSSTEQNELRQRKSTRAPQGSSSSIISEKSCPPPYDYETESDSDFDEKKSKSKSKSTSPPSLPLLSKHQPPSKNTRDTTGREKGTEKKGQKQKQKQPPSALYQFSALPSANLRRAQERFKVGLAVVVGQEAVQEVSVEKVDQQQSDGDGIESREKDKDKKVTKVILTHARKGQVGLINLVRRLTELEEEIRSARRILQQQPHQEPERQ